MAILDVLQFKGTPDIFAWKYPNDELATWSKVVVHESQEAVLFKGGQAFDILPAGTHTLNTENIPLLSAFVNLPYGGDSPFKAEVWFINKAHSLDIKWGTTSPIQLQDPKYKVFVPLRAFGQFGIRIRDSKQFLIKMVGTMPFFNRDTMTDYFRGIYVTRVKDAISTYLVKKQISVVEINAFLDEISEFLKESLSVEMVPYGLDLINFNVNDISVPENDPAVIQLKSALAKRAEMDIIGYNYQQERSFDTLEGAATNPSSLSGSMMGAGIGLGMGAGIGPMFGMQMNDMSKNLSNEEKKSCPKCGAALDANARFCHKCGTDTMQNDDKVQCSKCGAAIGKTMKFCPECGSPYVPCVFCQADLPDGAQICPKCGKKQPLPCPGCGAKVAADAKFCPECGMSLAKKCSNCGTEYEGTPKFCPECGNPLG